MTTFEDILNLARDAAQTAGQKTTEIVDTTKLKMEISRAEKELAATYEGLGRLVYDAKKGAEDVSELMDACVVTIDEQTERLAQLRDRLASKKHAVRCPVCGLYNEQDAVYCKSCGEKL